MGSILELLADPRVAALLKAGIDIATRHMAEHDGEILGVDEVRAKLETELREGQSAIAAEFAAKGWTLPA